MRLNRLDLDRYGTFTDYSIDFGDRQAGRPDLHIVYGPNEAGKSTMLAAFLDLLFGIETRKKGGYNFLHPYPTMRIGGALEIGGSVQDFTRVKRQQNSLLDTGDRPIAENAILAEVGGIDRKAYRDMFSLDDETLEAGGESILASKGDLGELLFSASAGLADLSHGLGAIRDEAERYFKTSRSGALFDLKKTLEALKAERADIDTLASKYASLLKARDQATGLYDGMLASRGLIQARTEEIQRHLNALPRLAALRRITGSLASSADLPDVPRHWARDLPSLMEKEVELDVRVRDVAQTIESLSCALGQIVVDEDVVVDHAARLEALTDLRARHRTAEKDLPERRQRLREAEASVSSLLRRIEREGDVDPKHLVLGASIAGRLRDLIEARSGIDAALTSAATEAAKSSRRLEEEREALRSAANKSETAPGHESAMAALAATLVAFRSDDHAARRRLAQRQADEHRAALENCLRALRPWRGNAEALGDMTLPDPVRLASWRAAAAEAQKSIDRHARDVERLETEARRHAAEREAIGALSGIVTDPEAMDIRARRDAAWSEHRLTLEAGSADRFEAALRLDDEVTGSRLAHVVDLARLNQAAQAFAVATAEGEHAAALRHTSVEALSRIGDEVASMVRAAAPALIDMTLLEFEPWMLRRQRALEVHDQVRAADRASREAELDGDAARKRLRAALDGAGARCHPDSDFEALMASAEIEVERELRLRTLRGAVTEREHDSAAREQQLQEALARELTWIKRWAEACSACWLGEDGAAPPWQAARDILPVLADLGPALEVRRGLADRIEKMEGDQAAFEAAIAPLADAMGIAHTSGSTQDLARALDDRIRVARADAARYKAETQDLEDARGRWRELAASVEIHRHRVAEMTGAFGVATLAEVALKLGEVEKRDDLKRQAAEAERDVLDMLRMSSLDEAERALDSTDRSAIELEVAELKTRYEDLDQRCRDLFVQQARAADAVEAIGGDAGVAEIEERRRTTLLEIEDGALRYLKLRVGALAAEQALRVYRDRHRSSMMELASKAFSTISRGAYSGLAAQPGNDTETLIALPAGGGSKQAVELSKGTRFQLYLALRVAGYHEFARTRPTVPFIADDIMETFDDFRAEEAFRLFGQMAEVGQVIYLTHHRHLCQIARNVCPGVMVHEIAIRSA